jgi:hypothetical protein
MVFQQGADFVKDRKQYVCAVVLIFYLLGTLNRAFLKMTPLLLA